MMLEEPQVCKERMGAISSTLLRCVLVHCTRVVRELDRKGPPCTGIACRLDAQLLRHVQSCTALGAHFFCTEQATCGPQ